MRPDSTPSPQTPLLRSWNRVELRQDGQRRVLKKKHWSRYHALFLVAGMMGLILWLLLTSAVGAGVASALMVPLAILLSVPAIGTIRQLDGRELLYIDMESRTLHTPDGTARPTDETTVYELHYNGLRFQRSCLILAGERGYHEVFRVGETRPQSSPMGYLCSISDIDYRIKPIYSWDNLADEIREIRKDERN